MGERDVNEAGQAKRFGIDRTLWRMLMLTLFVILAAIGCFLSVAKGAADISLSQIFTILLHLEYTVAPDDRRRTGGYESGAFRLYFAGGHAQSAG